MASGSGSRPELPRRLHPPWNVLIASMDSRLRMFIAPIFSVFKLIQKCVKSYAAFLWAARMPKSSEHRVNTFNWVPHKVGKNVAFSNQFCRGLWVEQGWPRISWCLIQKATAMLGHIVARAAVWPGRPLLFNVDQRFTPKRRSRFGNSTHNNFLCVKNRTIATTAYNFVSAAPKQNDQKPCNIAVYMCDAILYP